MRRVRRGGWAAAVALALLPGCGWLTLVHDQMLGPVSPLGRIHDTAVGSGFRVTRSGPVADAAGQALLRPYPLDLVERLGAPHSLYSLVKGMEALVAGFSFVVQRESVTGRPPAPDARAALRPGLGVGRVLRLLGPPQLWIRRKSGSLMLYRSRDRRTFAFYVGVPPPAAALLPVPGASNVRFRYSSETERADKLLLFFDTADVLRAVATNLEPAGDAR